MLLLSMDERVSLVAGVLFEGEGFPERSFAEGTTVVLSFFAELSDLSFLLLRSWGTSEVLELRSLLLALGVPEVTISLRP